MQYKIARTYSNVVWPDRHGIKRPTHISFGQISLDLTKVTFPHKMLIQEANALVAQSRLKHQGPPVVEEMIVSEGEILPGDRVIEVVGASAVPTPIPTPIPTAEPEHAPEPEQEPESEEAESSTDASDKPADDSTSDEKEIPDTDFV